MAIPNPFHLRRNTSPGKGGLHIVKPVMVLLFIVSNTIAASAQTLFSYGNHIVGKAEFLKAYNKNYSDSSNLKISYTSYLDLYARFRMKVQAALDEKMDTTAQQISEVRAFHDQLAESFLKDGPAMKLLTDEAAKRSLKDIHLTAIYVPVKHDPAPGEVAAAEARIKGAYAQLTKGAAFEKVAAQYNYADFGYITTFVLPYAIETIAYSTPLGKYAKPFRTGQGFYIFRPVEARRALGKIRIAQILFVFPPGSGDQEKKHVAQRADSAYQALQEGADFGDLATRLSNDNLSYQTRGELPVFGIGKYDPVFEQTAFGLARDGDISKPFGTLFGIHILRRMQRIPVMEDVNNKEWRAEIKARIEQSDRMEVAQTMLLQNIRKTIKQNAPAAVQSNDSAALAYYRDHLEKYNAEFAGQLHEFKEGNLLFTIMQNKVWNASTADSSALLKYYNNNKDKYWWENSADALIMTCPDKKDVENARDSVKINFPDWKKWARASNDRIQADSGRYELSQIPVAERTNFTKGLITAPVANSQDSSMTFAYIIKLYKEREPKKFEDAKGAVISDYQAYLENKWLKELRQKYPVRVNRAVFDSLPKN